MILYMDPKVCNSALWIYPLSKNRCQIGIGEISITKTVSNGFLRLSLLRAVKNVSCFKKMLARARIDESTVVFGNKPVIEPIEKMYADKTSSLLVTVPGKAPLLSGKEFVRPYMLARLLHRQLSEHLQRNHLKRVTSNSVKSYGGINSVNTRPGT
jgi:hypothetical protein